MIRQGARVISPGLPSNGVSDTMRSVEGMINRATQRPIFKYALTLEERERAVKSGLIRYPRTVTGTRLTDLPHPTCTAQDIVDVYGFAGTGDVSTALKRRGVKSVSKGIYRTGSVIKAMKKFPYKAQSQA